MKYPITLEKLKELHISITHFSGYQTSYAGVWTHLRGIFWKGRLKP